VAEHRRDEGRASCPPATHPIFRPAGPRALPGDWETSGSPSRMFHLVRHRGGSHRSSEPTARRRPTDPSTVASPAVPLTSHAAPAITVEVAARPTTRSSPLPDLELGRAAHRKPEVRVAQRARAATAALAAGAVLAGASWTAQAPAAATTAGPTDQTAVDRGGPRRGLSPSCPRHQPWPRFRGGRPAGEGDTVGGGAGRPGGPGASTTPRRPPRGRSPPASVPDGGPPTTASTSPTPSAPPYWR
jgi:hypothetical protein